MRVSVIVLLCAVSVSTFAADQEVLANPGKSSLERLKETLIKQAPFNYKPIDLSGQDAREALRDSNPAAYAKAIQLLEAASRLSCERDELKALQVQLEIQPVNCRSVLLKTSYPAKREIDFFIDGQRYHSLVKVVDTEVELVPLKPAK